MIEIRTEQVIPLGHAPKHLPGRPHIATLYRWANRRHRPLETVAIGGRIYTSVEALERFAEQRSGPPAETPPSADAARRHARAEAELDAAGC